MSDNATIAAAIRTEFGKGAARRIRRDHKIPAVLYGSGTDPVHLTLPGHETMLAVKVSNALLDLEIEGGKRQLALVKDVQRDPIKPIIEHVDLVVVRRGEKVTVEVAVTVTGEAAPETVVTTENSVLEIEAEATNIPENFEVSVEGAAAGTQILASEVTLPAGVTLVSDPELLVVNVTQAISAEALEAELEAAEADAGIEKEESEEEVAEGAEAESAEGEAAPAEGEEESSDKE
ncbi:50S ribosomal protein L25/general stress protein Ctc [Mobilicoccus massiliensis]|uniref:50S ribosomal protein L25/general stress protein Ctc n=1 Tax=Mobilicoccus massiliensis TaxID=1522310 RepID=UPI00058F0E33|nr:50S ribosomal protein L25/general stress protein Ctc [Mobilicoccus massiliensis]